MTRSEIGKARTKRSASSPARAPLHRHLHLEEPDGDERKAHPEQEREQVRKADVDVLHEGAVPGAHQLVVGPDRAPHGGDGVVADGQVQRAVEGQAGQGRDRHQAHDAPEARPVREEGEHGDHAEEEEQERRGVGHEAGQGQGEAAHDRARHPSRALGRRAQERPDGRDQEHHHRPVHRRRREQDHARHEQEQGQGAARRRLAVEIAGEEEDGDRGEGREEDRGQPGRHQPGAEETADDPEKQDGAGRMRPRVVRHHVVEETAREVAQEVGRPLRLDLGHVGIGRERLRVRVEDGGLDAAVVGGDVAVDHGHARPDGEEERDGGEEQRGGADRRAQEERRAPRAGRRPAPRTQAGATG